VQGAAELEGLLHKILLALKASKDKKEMGHHLP
jgi:hypothetical protein